MSNDGLGQKIKRGCYLYLFPAPYAGAGWRVIEQGGAFTTAAEAAADLVSGVIYTVEFARLAGWLAPTNFSVKLPAGQSVLSDTRRRKSKLSCGTTRNPGDRQIVGL